jgi:hypothetical protein
MSDNDEALQFSYIGYKTQNIKVGNKTRINIALEADSRSLNEVVVMGYQMRAEKKMVTASVMTIGHSSPPPAYGISRSVYTRAQYRKLCRHPGKRVS